ncbi:MAG: triose-phosphate isomerase [Bacilli bacterium]
MSRKIFLMGNWKMNHTIQEANDFCDAVKANGLVKIARKKGVMIGVAPSYISLQAVSKHAHGMIVASQDCHYAASGAYTSCISVPMLKEINVDWAIIGHSEKRQFEGETDFDCNRKIKTLVANGFHAIYCVGESAKEYDQGLTKDVIKAQVVTGLMNISKEQMANVVIAYEPVWSIGTGKNASVEIAQDICSFIRGVISELFGKVASQKVLVLYGGSVKPENVNGYMSAPDVDGALVGGASLKADSFAALLNNI